VTARKGGGGIPPTLAAMYYPISTFVVPLPMIGCSQGPTSVFNGSIQGVFDMKISCNVNALQRSIICCQSCRSAIRRLLVGPRPRPAVAARRAGEKPPRRGSPRRREKSLFGRCCDANCCQLLLVGVVTAPVA